MKKHPLGREEGGESKKTEFAKFPRQPFLHKSLITEQPKKKKSTQENNIVQKLRQQKLRELQTVSQPGFHKPR